MIRTDAETPVYRFVACEDTAIVAWRRAPSLDATVKMYSFLNALAGERKTRIYVFVVIGSFDEMPDSSVRQAMAESMAKTTSITHLIVSVIEGDGFRAAAIRSIASGMQMLARKTAPMKVFRTIDEGVEFLAREKKCGLLEREELSQAVRLARNGA